MKTDQAGLPPPIPGAKGNPALPPLPDHHVGPKKKKYTAVKIAIVSTILAGSAGYYAYGVRDERETATKQLIETRTLLGVCQKDRDDTKTQNTQLGGQVITSAKESERQKAEIDAKEQKLSETQTTLQGTQTELQASKVELDQLRKQHEESEKRLAAFKDLTDKFQKMIGAGKLSVMFRDGRMIVKLPAGVLFDSGKAELSKDGQMAIMEVAVVLKEFPDRKFMVVGHTDSLPLDPKMATTYKDNWELSTARAVQVTEFLVSAGMKPENLLAAGYGQYDPVKSNKTEAGRKENRRIEIVLLPNIDELPPVPEGADTAPKKD
jgi:chemotaxis protein MotB